MDRVPPKKLRKIIAFKSSCLLFLDRVRSKCFNLFFHKSSCSLSNRTADTGKHGIPGEHGCDFMSFISDQNCFVFLQPMEDEKIECINLVKKYIRE